MSCAAWPMGSRENRSEREGAAAHALLQRGDRHRPLDAAQAPDARQREAEAELDGVNSAEMTIRKE
jgi:hypothetical protein